MFPINLEYNLADKNAHMIVKMGGGEVIEILHYLVDDKTDIISYNTELLFGSPQR